MTSTGTYQGLLEGRNTSKVLKPPGGGSSDIFGAAGESEVVDSPRRSKAQQQSQLGSALFDQPASNGVPQMNGKNSGGNPVTGAGYGNGSEQPPSPTSHQNGGGSIGSSNSSEKSSTDSSPSASVNNIHRLRNRVPPGGYSSGLW